MNNNLYILFRRYFFMNEECLNHNESLPVDYLRELQGKYKPSNSEELFNIALEEMRKSRGVYKFRDYKFKKN